MLKSRTFLLRGDHANLCATIMSHVMSYYMEILFTFSSCLCLILCKMSETLWFPPTVNVRPASSGWIKLTDELIAIQFSIRYRSSKKFPMLLGCHIIIVTTERSAYALCGESFHDLWGIEANRTELYALISDFTKEQTLFSQAMRGWGGSYFICQKWLLTNVMRQRLMWMRDNADDQNDCTSHCKHIITYQHVYDYLWCSY